MTSKVWSSVKSCHIILESKNMSSYCVLEKKYDFLAQVNFETFFSDVSFTRYKNGNFQPPLYVKL